jgi:uncharacterized membrane protein YadS
VSAILWYEVDITWRKETQQSRKEGTMKKFRAYLLFFLMIVLLSSIGVAAEKAVKSLKAERGAKQVITAMGTAGLGQIE